MINKVKVIKISENMGNLQIKQIFPDNDYLKSKINMKELNEYMNDFNIENVEIVMNADLSNFDNMQIIDAYINNMELY